MQHYGEVNRIEINEKQLTLDLFNYMVTDKAIVFPSDIKKNIRVRKRASQMITDILCGLPMEDIYLSELQNGELLSLTLSDELFVIIEFLNNKCSLDLSEYTEKNDLVYFDELCCDNPGLFGYIMRTSFKAYIIDYRMPKYSHMRVGVTKGNWTIEREQIIRNIIYDTYKKNELEHLSKFISFNSFIFTNKSKWALQYELLVMFAIWNVYKYGRYMPDNIHEEELLEYSLYAMNDSEKVDIYVAVLGILDDYIYRCKPFIHKMSTRHEARFFGFIICWLDMLNGQNIEPDGVQKVINERKIIYRIKEQRLSKNNIQDILEYIWRRLKHQ